MNGLWIVSLGLTLMTTLIIGLIKQWLNYYLSNVDGSPKHRACIRRFRYNAVYIWGVSAIIELLPILMNVSLLLFFAGLVLFSHGLNGSDGITKAVIALTCLSFALYLVTSPV